MLFKSCMLLGMAATGSAMCPMGYAGSTTPDIEQQRQLRVDCPTLSASTPDDYESWTAEKKIDYLREKVLENTNSVEPVSQAVAGLKVMLEDMSVTEDWESDEMPVPKHFWESERVKPIHHLGFMAEVTVDWKKGHPYTGMFQDTAKGFIRAASASDPDYTQADPLKGNFAPGIALKLLRDGKPSGNLFAIHDLVSVNSWSFFKTTVTNHIPYQHLDAVFTVVMKKFSTAPSDWPAFTGLSAFARTHQDGSVVDEGDINFPFQIVFEGNPELAALTPDEGPLPGTFYEATLSKVEPGTLLYTILAKDTHDAKPVVIGEVHSTSKFTPSYYGDTKLFFQHTRYDEDLKLRPELWEGCTVNTCETCPAEIPCE